VDARREFRRQREIARERRECARHHGADSPREARQAYREASARSRKSGARCARGAPRTALRRLGQDRNRVGEIIAGVALGAIIVSARAAWHRPAHRSCAGSGRHYQERGYWIAVAVTAVIDSTALPWATGWCPAAGRPPMTSWPGERAWTSTCGGICLEAQYLCACL